MCNIYFSLFKFFQLNGITKEVISVQTSDQIAWTDVCFK